MARPRQYATAAERQAAYRERKKAELADPELPEREIDEPDTTELEEVSASESLEQYVARELAITQDQLDRGILRDIEHNGETTLQRSERYLRWRYAAFKRGEVSSL